MSFEFFRFSTLSTNHTLSYMANPLHFASASNPRITHNEKCSVLRPAELRLAFWTPKCLAAQPRNFPETNGQIAHIRAHISPTIHATVTNVSSADLYSYGLHVWFVQSPNALLLEFLFVPDCASSMVARSH